MQICNLDKVALRAKEKLSSEEASYILGDKVLRIAYASENGWTVKLVKKEYGYHISFRTKGLLTEGVSYEYETLAEDEDQVIAFLKEAAEKAKEEAMDAIEDFRHAYYDI